MYKGENPRVNNANLTQLLDSMTDRGEYAGQDPKKRPTLKEATNVFEIALGKTQEFKVSDINQAHKNYVKQKERWGFGFLRWLMTSIATEKALIDLCDENFLKAYDQKKHINPTMSATFTLWGKGIKV